MDDDRRNAGEREQTIRRLARIAFEADVAHMARIGHAAPAFVLDWTYHEQIGTPLVARYCAIAGAVLDAQTRAMDAAASSNTVFWVIQNARSGEEETVLGAFMAPPWLPYESLVEREDDWRATHPYGKASEFLDWLVTDIRCTRVDVQVYPFDD